MPRADAAKMRGLIREARLDRGQAAEARIRGKRVRFTPSEAVATATLEELEKDGAVVGVLETELSGDETPLQPGTYHMFITRDSGQGWEAYALDDEGEVRAKAARVEVQTKRGVRSRAGVEEGSWRFWVAVGVIAASTLVFSVIVYT